MVKKKTQQIVKTEDEIKLEQKNTIMKNLIFSMILNPNEYYDGDVFDIIKMKINDGYLFESSEIAKDKVELFNGIISLSKNKILAELASNNTMKLNLSMLVYIAKNSQYYTDERAEKVNDIYSRIKDEFNPKIKVNDYFYEKNKLALFLNDIDLFNVDEPVDIDLVDFIEFVSLKSVLIYQENVNLIKELDKNKLNSLLKKNGMTINDLILKVLINGFEDKEKNGIILEAIKKFDLLDTKFFNKTLFSSLVLKSKKINNFSEVYDFYDDHLFEVEKDILFSKKNEKWLAKSLINKFEVKIPKKIFEKFIYRDGQGTSISSLLGGCEWKKLLNVIKTYPIEKHNWIIFPENENDIFNFKKSFEKILDNFFKKSKIYREKEGDNDKFMEFLSFLSNNNILYQEFKDIALMKSFEQQEIKLFDLLLNMGANPEVKIGRKTVKERVNDNKSLGPIFKEVMEKYLLEKTFKLSSHNTKKVTI